MSRASHLKAKYGLTLGQFNLMLANQNGCCSICGGPPLGGSGKTFHVDHDHSTGQIRGLLCGHCNTGLGLLGDSREGLLAASEYLARAAAEVGSAPKIASSTAKPTKGKK